MVGALTLPFLAQRVLLPPRARRAAAAALVGFLLGIASGFTSFVAHAGGPPVGAYVLPLRMAPVAFTATMAVFFAARQPVEVDSVRVARPDRRAQHGHRAGAGAAGADRRLARRELMRRVAAEAGSTGWLRRHAATGVKLLWDGLR